MGEKGVTIETAQQRKGKGCYHRDSTMEERGVNMETAQWGEGCYHGDSMVGREVLPWRQYSGGEWRFCGDSTVGGRVTMETVSTVGERGVTMETA